MFGKLPEIFGRDFAVAYLLPAAVFIAINPRLTVATGSLRLYLADSALESAIVFALAAWFGGVLLMAVNPILIRMLAGYGRLNPAQLFRWLEASRFEKLARQISKLDAERDACIAASKEPHSNLQEERTKLNLKAAERFPDQISRLLPTAFGNTIRAFEVYPQVVYGVDAIYGWNRLVAVVPKEYREQVDAAKAQMDLWVNLLFLSAATAVGYTIVYFQRWVVSLLIVTVTLASVFVCYRMSCNAARLWGDLIKASFDVFLPELRKRLEFGFPADKTAEQALWTGFSQSMIYRRKDTLPERVEQPQKGA